MFKNNLFLSWVFSILLYSSLLVSERCLKTCWVANNLYIIQLQIITSIISKPLESKPLFGAAECPEKGQQFWGCRRCDSPGDFHNLFQGHGRDNVHLQIKPCQQMLGISDYLGFFICFLVHLLIYIDQNCQSRGLEPSSAHWNAVDPTQWINLKHRTAGAQHLNRCSQCPPAGNHVAPPAENPPMTNQPRPTAVGTWFFTFASHTLKRCNFLQLARRKNSLTHARTYIHTRAHTHIHIYIIHTYVLYINISRCIYGKHNWTIYTVWCA